MNSRADPIPDAPSSRFPGGPRPEVDRGRLSLLGCSEKGRSPLETATKGRAFFFFSSPAARFGVKSKKKQEAAGTRGQRVPFPCSLSLSFLSAALPVRRGACAGRSRGNWGVLHRGRGAISWPIGRKEGLPFVAPSLFPFFQPWPSSRPLALAARFFQSTALTNYLPASPPQSTRTQLPSSPFSSLLLHIKRNCCEREKEGRTRGKEGRCDPP